MPIDRDSRPILTSVWKPPPNYITRSRGRPAYKYRPRSQVDFPASNRVDLPLPRRSAMHKTVSATFARNSGFTAAADPATLGQRPGHSHSIVSSTCKHLKVDDFLSEGFNFTDRITVGKSCLGTIEGDGCRTTRSIRARTMRMDLARAVVACGQDTPRSRMS